MRSFRVRRYRAGQPSMTARGVLLRDSPGRSKPVLNQSAPADADAASTTRCAALDVNKGEVCHSPALRQAPGDRDARLSVTFQVRAHAADGGPERARHVSRILFLY